MDKGLEDLCTGHVVFHRETGLPGVVLAPPSGNSVSVLELSDQGGATVTWDRDKLIRVWGTHELSGLARRESDVFPEDIVSRWKKDGAVAKLVIDDP